MSGMVAEAEMVMARRIAVSAYQSFRYALHNVGPRDQVLPAWDGLPEEAQDGWFRAVFVVKVATEHAEGVPWKEIAQQAYEVYARACGATVAWATLERKQQIAWEAAARQILALFESEDLTEDEIDRMESQWTKWADRRGTNERASVESTNGVQG